MSNSMLDKNRAILTGGGALLLGLIVLFYLAYRPKAEVLQGFLEAREYSVSSKVPGRIEKVFVKKGDHIKKGDLVFSISSPELEAKLAQAEAGHKAAKALSDEVKRGSRDETINSARDVWQAAKSQATLAKETYKRVQDLYDNGVASLQKRDEAYAAYESTKYNESAAYQKYKMALGGASSESKIAAKAKESAALGQVNEVESYLKDVKATAPIDGEVSNVLLSGGELSPKGFPVVLMIDLKDSWLKISVPEKYLNEFKVGKEFEGYIPALKKSAKFRVKYLSVMGDFATWKATNNSNTYDMKSYEVEAIPLEELENFRVGMSVLVTIKP
ncbi:HlyD family secretion protein [Helicobacter pylori]|uniref:HlyD family secretion protein n=1 Tax=Helicobacter pylori TaxID=210 RepID=UPI00292A10D0|nr:efflux RND transporter periplasmic adaptor subunit [Helicobacter pylori]MDU9806469.1 efflux RND transporter periplasmic adaptor subunit [Helicobacter pylori]